MTFLLQKKTIKKQIGVAYVTMTAANRPNLLAHKVCFTCSEKGHINKNCPKSSILEVMRKAMDNYQLGKQKKEDIITQMVEAANGNYSFDNKPLMI